MELSVVGVGIEYVPPYTVPVRVASEAETTWVLGAAVETSAQRGEIVLRDLNAATHTLNLASDTLGTN